MCAIILQVSDTQQQESHVEREEEEKEGDGGSERAEKQQEGEDEPAHEEETEGVEECGFAALHECRFDLEASGGQDDGEGEPETSVGGEGGGTEGVTYGHFPLRVLAIALVEL
jgi:hypothetical protein